jgi:hypothetical protein
VHINSAVSGPHQPASASKHNKFVSAVVSEKLKEKEALRLIVLENDLFGNLQHW